MDNVDKENASSNILNNKTVLTFSPVKSTPTATIIKSEPKLELCCGTFQESLSINFGSVAVKSTLFKTFYLKNINQRSVSINIDQVPADLGIMVKFEGSQTQIEIPALQSVPCTVYWTPSRDMTMREIVKFKMDGKAPLQLILQGVAGCGKVDGVLSKTISSFPSSNSLLKKSSSSSRRHSDVPVGPKIKSKPLALDDKWAEKQTNSFTDWINFTFTESHSTGGSDIPDEQPHNDENDAFGICELSKKQNENKTRQAASVMFRTESMSKVIQSVSDEIESGKLCMRHDRDVLHDLGLLEALYGILFSYEMPWLCLGLEVVCGKTLDTGRQQQQKQQKLKSALKSFIVDNFLSDSTILAQFPKQSLMYQSKEKQLKQMLHKSILQKFLSLVLFLDTGRKSNLLSLSTLFLKDSIYKSSKDVINSFCRCFLKGEGDLIRHLALLNYHVSFTQTYIDEFDFTVSNLALDLRDGVRLAKLIDVLTKSSQKTTSLLRTPAVSRLQKLHNVGVVVGLVPLGGKIFDAKQIVDGNRDQTLIFLWQLMYTFELRMLISTDKINAEITTVRKSDSLRYSFAESAEDAKDQNDLAVKLSLTRTKLTDDESNDVDQNDTFEAAIMKWCQCIADQYDVSVSNLTASMADGRVLCLLIHYYHPSILPLDCIKKTSAHLPVGGSVASADLQRAINGERRNHLTAQKACKNIGGIPLMLPECDSKNPPEEKSMTLFLGYLFSRLTESAEQVRAAICLQQKFRKFKGFKRPAWRNAVVVPVIVPAAAELEEEEVPVEISAVEVEVISEELSPVAESAPIEEVDSELQAKMARDLEMKALVAERRAKMEAELLAELELENIIDAETHAQLAVQAAMQQDLENKLTAELNERIEEELAAQLAMEQAAYEHEVSEGLRQQLEAELTAKLEEEKKAIEIKLVEELRERLAVEHAAKLVLEKQEYELKLAQEMRERQLAEELRARVEAELTAKLEMEKQLLLSLEQQVLDAGEKYDAALAASRMEQYSEMEAHRAAIEASEAKLQHENSVRMQVEELLKNSQLDMERERECVHQLDQQKLQLEEKLQQEHSNYLADLERVAGESESAWRARAEETRLLAESAMEQERNARAALELKMQAEVEARLALEQKLRDMELNQQLQEEAKIKRKTEKLVKEMLSKRCSKIIQRWWRAKWSQYIETVKLNGVVKFQAVCRGVVVRRNARRAELAVLILQSLWRRRKCAKMLVLCAKAASIILSAWKRYLVAKANKKIASCASKIRNSWLRCRAVKSFSATRKHIIRIQSMCRMHSHRQQYRKTVAKVVTLQSVMRMKVSMLRKSRSIKAVRSIQSIWRHALKNMKISSNLSDQQRHQAADRLRLHCIVKKIVAFIRSSMFTLRSKRAALCITRWYLSRLPLLRATKLCNGFRRLAAVRRARRVRQKSSQKVKDMLKRIRAAEERARADPSLKLGKQTAAGLKLLQGSNGKMISQVLKACQILELSTQVSKYCCEAFAQARASNILFNLLRSCNRSTPHQELMRIALVVLLNVARHDHLAAVVAQVNDSTDTMVDLLQMFRDKKPLFILAAELLTRLVQASSHTKDLCNALVLRKRLDGIKHIMLSKSRIDKTMSKIGMPKHASPVFGSPEGSNKFAQYKGKAYKSIEPIDCMEHLMELLS